jgi:amino acid transporter
MAKTEEKEFEQHLGLFDSTMLVAGAMIGSGIFIVSADIMRDVGCSGTLLLLWLVTGVITIFGALSYAELAGMMPKAGGQYVYLREAFGPFLGFLYGWSLFLVIQTGSIAAVGVAFTKFLGVLFPGLGTSEEAVISKWEGINLAISLPLPWLKEPLQVFHREDFTITMGQIIAAVIILILTWVNCRGIRQGTIIQNLFTITKICSLAAVVLIGFSVGMNMSTVKSNLQNLWSGASETARFNTIQHLVGGPGWLVTIMVAGGAMVGSLFSADAWNNITFTAGEIKNPKRNLPLSLIFGTCLVIGLYILVNLAYMAVLPANGDSQLATQLKAEVASNKSIVKEYQAQANLFKSTAQRLSAESEFLEARAKYLEKNSQPLMAKRLEHDARERKEESSDWFAKARTARQAVQDASQNLENRLKEMSKQNTTNLGISFAKDDRVGTAMLQAVSPNFGAGLMAIAIMISTFGCLNGMILMGARLYFAMAKDGLFFKSIADLNGNGVPEKSLWLQAIWSVLLVFSGTYSELLDYVIFAALLFYALTVAGLFVLRRTKPDADRPYKAWGYPLIPLIYIALCILIMIDLLIVRPEFTWPGLILVASGIPVFYFWNSKGYSHKTDP